MSITIRPILLLESFYSPSLKRFAQFLRGGYLLRGSQMVNFDQSDTPGTRKEMEFTVHYFQRKELSKMSGNQVVCLH